MRKLTQALDRGIGPSEGLTTPAEATRLVPKVDGKKVSVHTSRLFAAPRSASARTPSAALPLPGEPFSDPKRFKKRAESAQAILSP
jgi:hypothetical protein